MIKKLIINILVLSSSLIKSEPERVYLSYKDLAELGLIRLSNTSPIKIYFSNQQLTSIIALGYNLLVAAGANEQYISSQLTHDGIRAEMMEQVKRQKSMPLLQLQAIIPTGSQQYYITQALWNQYTQDNAAWNKSPSELSVDEALSQFHGINKSNKRTFENIRQLVQDLQSLRADAERIAKAAENRRNFTMANQDPDEEDELYEEE